MAVAVGTFPPQMMGPMMAPPHSLMMSGSPHMPTRTAPVAPFPPAHSFNGAQTLGMPLGYAAASPSAAAKAIQLVSLGCSCGPKMAFDEMGRGQETLPLDWMCTTLEGVIGFLQNDFQGFFQFSTQECATMQGCGTKIEVFRAPQHSWWHDNPTLPETQEKYHRRIARFKGMRAGNETILFVRVAACTDEILKVDSLVQILQANFGPRAKLLLIVGMQMPNTAGPYLVNGHPNLMVYFNTAGCGKSLYCNGIAAGLEWAAGTGQNCQQAQDLHSLHSRAMPSHAGYFGMGGLAAFENMSPHIKAPPRNSITTSLQSFPMHAAPPSQMASSPQAPVFKSSVLGRSPSENGFAAGEPRRATSSGQPRRHSFAEMQTAGGLPGSIESSFPGSFQTPLQMQPLGTWAQPPPLRTSSANTAPLRHSTVHPCASSAARQRSPSVGRIPVARFAFGAGEGQEENIQTPTPPVQSFTPAAQPPMFNGVMGDAEPVPLHMKKETEIEDLYPVGLVVEIWSKSSQAWCSAVVDHIDGVMVFVKYRNPAGATMMKGIPYFHTTIRKPQR